MSADVDQSWGPAVRGRGRRRVPLVRLVAGLLLLVLLGGALFLAWITSRIPKLDVEHLASGGSPMHVLVVGSDSRADLTPEERRALRTGSAEGERTDTIFLMTIQGGDLALLAFPRDLWVRRCDGSEGRINAAVQIGGPGCLVRTVRELSGIPVHHYVQVTFGGFRDVVDAVGGVELCLDQPIADRDAGIDLPAGCQQLDGQEALGFVRVRKIDDDFGRIGRQQQFLRALVDEVATPSRLLNPTRLVPLASEMGEAVATDRRLGVVAMARLGWAVRALAGGDAPAHVVPADPSRTSGGADVLLVRAAEAERLFAGFRDGSVLASEGDGGLRPADVEVDVLNGAGIDGLAGRTAEALRERGYQVRDVGNAPPVAETVVRHPPDQRAAAELLAADLLGRPGIEETTEVERPTVVLGADAGG